MEDKNIRFDAHVACVTLAETLAKHKGVGTSNCLIMSSKMNGTDKDLYYFNGNGGFQLTAFVKFATEILSQLDKEKKFRLLNRGLLYRLVDQAVEKAYED